MKLSVIDYGGIITNAFIPDKDGNVVDVILGHDTYEGNHILCTVSLRALPYVHTYL